MVKKSLFVLLTSRFTSAEQYCESSDECLDGGICNFDFDYGGFCETCPGNTEQSCYDTGFHNDKGTDECKSICIPQDDEDQDEPGAENDCGDCWEADENGDCVPEAGRITTICGPDSIKMTIESCVFGEKYEAVYIGVDEAVYVGSDHDDSNCRLTYDQSYHESYGRVAYSLEHGLSDCGMTMNYDSDSIVFRNQMNVPPKTRDGIFTSRPLEWNFQCSYDSSYDLTADEISMDASAKTGAFSGTGQFDIDMSFYANGNFNDDELQEGSHQVGKPVFFGITWHKGSSLSQLEFVPTQCEVVNMADTSEVYQLWDSADELMCHPDIAHPVHFNIAAGQDETFEISYQGFAFDSVTGSVGQQQLKCTVEICNPDDDSSPCKTGCFEPTAEPTTTDTTRVWDVFP